MFLNTCWSLNQSLCSVPWGRNLSHPVWQGALILLNASNKIHTGAAKVWEKRGEMHFRRKEQWSCSPQSPGVNSGTCAAHQGLEKAVQNSLFSGCGADKGCWLLWIDWWQFYVTSVGVGCEVFACRVIGISPEAELPQHTWSAQDEQCLCEKEALKECTET